MTHRPPTPKDVTRWLDDAQHALDHAPSLTVDQLRALAATPDTTGRHDTDRRTWWSEEAARISVKAAREKRPDDPDAIAYWTERQAHYAAQIEALHDAHADALASTTAHALGPSRASSEQLHPKKPKRRTAADLSLDSAA